MKPTVGLPTVANAGCAYGAELDSPLCGRPVTVHLLIDSDGWGRVALDSCDDHAPIGRSSGVLLDEHPYRPDCVDGRCFA